MAMATQKAADALREQLTEVDDAIAEKGDMTNVALGLFNETLSNSMNNLLSIWRELRIISESIWQLLPGHWKHWQARLSFSSYSRRRR